MESGRRERSIDGHTGSAVELCGEWGQKSHQVIRLLSQKIPWYGEGSERKIMGGEGWVRLGDLNIIGSGYTMKHSRHYARTIKW